MGEDGRIVYKVVLDDGNVVSEAQAAGKKAGNALKDAKGGAGILQEVMVGAARKIGEAFVDMASQAGGAVKSFVEDSINVGANFEKSVDQIAATLGYSAADIANNVDGAADKMAALEAKAKEMGASTNFTATQAAEGLNILAMSGYDAEHSIAMIEDVLHLAAAGSMDMAQAAGSILEDARMFDVFRSPVLGLDRKSVAFSFTLRGADHTLTEEEITRAMNKILKVAEEKYGAAIRG